jgi:predicted dehydrogenase
LRIGFIGAGLIAGNYIDSLKRLGRSVACICDTDALRAEQVAAELGCPAYDDHAVMLGRNTLDVVFVATPPSARLRPVSDAVRAGAAVFVAKPVALDLDTARRTLDAISKAGVINQVGYMARYSDITEKARQLTGDRPLALGAGHFLHRLREHHWWGKREATGGQMVEQSTHLFDLLRYFLGEIVEVHAYGYTGLPGSYADFEDCSVCNLRFANSAIGHVTSTCRADGIDCFTAEFMGREIYVRLSMDHSLQARIAEERVEYNGEESGYFRQIEEFLKAVGQNDQDLVRSSYQDGAKTLAATIAANRSLITARPEQVIVI